MKAGGAVNSSVQALLPRRRMWHPAACPSRLGAKRALRGSKLRHVGAGSPAFFAPVSLRSLEASATASESAFGKDQHDVAALQVEEHLRRLTSLPLNGSP